MTPVTDQVGTLTRCFAPDGFSTPAARCKWNGRGVDPCR